MDHRVIIVGAGPVGLTCAALLARADIPVLLLESTLERGRDLRASTWHPPTLDLLEQLDLAAPLVAAGLKTPNWQVRMHPSGDRAVFDLSVLADVTRHPYRLQCEQQVLCELLEAHLAQLRNVTLSRGAEVIDVVQADQRVAVEVRRTSGEIDTLTGDWVIGADGARSRVREAAGLRLEGSTYPETTLLATTTFRFEDHLEGLSNVNYCWSAEGTFSLLRLPQLWRVSLYADEGESTESALSSESIQAKLQRIVQTGQPYEVLESRPYRIHQRIVDNYRKGRVVLAGDAAHLNSPSGGMGMNGGLHDAFNLCDKLVRVWHGESEDLIDQYDRQRRPIAQQQIIAQAHQNRTRMQERDPVKRRETLRSLQATAADPVRAREYLLRTSMITGLREAATLP
jgi:3-(3-hydroxy-phenyl)propionate hydroxylase